VDSLEDIETAIAMWATISHRDGTDTIFDAGRIARD
jgi:hypothetical protein